MSADDYRPPGEGAPGPPTLAAADSTRERILGAAAQVFAEKGYVRATTRAIAAAADVNEVTLFRHFGNKLNLLLAVLDRFSAVPDLSAMMSGQFTGHYREDMLRLGHAFQGIMAARQTSIRLILCEAEQVPELRAAVGRMPLQLRQMLTAYLRHQIEAGHVRAMDPEVMAQAFFGMFFAYNISETFVPVPLAGGMSDEAVVEQFVDLFISGTIRQA
jgi:AcrR family transcriptional regulator